LAYNIKIIKPLFLIAIILFAKSSFSQFNNYWKMQRTEVTFGLGASNFLGELGGKDQIGTDYFNDLEITETKFAATVGYRYYILQNLSVKAGLYYGVISGSDKLTKEPFRNNRNLSFKSPIIESSAILEYHFLQERGGHKYKIRGAKGQSGFLFGIYGFAGIGGIYFNPKGQTADGKWHSLRPLSTEGQGLPGGAEPYKQITVAIPAGLGIRYSVNAKWKMGMEIGLRKTFSDYLDDVSTNYYDNAALAAAKGSVAAELADPNLGNFPGQFDSNGKTREGLQRGDPTDKDSYMFLIVTANYKISKRRGFKRIKSRRSVPSF
jgi:hypothetical protein